MGGKSPGHYRSERDGYVSSKDRRRILEASIVDAKVGKSSGINKIDCHYGRGRGSGRDDGGGRIGCCRTAKVTNYKSERADCVKCDFHYRRRSSTKCSQLSKELVITEFFAPQDRHWEIVIASAGCRWYIQFAQQVEILKRKTRKS